MVWHGAHSPRVSNAQSGWWRTPAEPGERFTSRASCEGQPAAAPAHPSGSRPAAPAHPPPRRPAGAGKQAGHCRWCTERSCASLARRCGGGGAALLLLLTPLPLWCGPSQTAQHVPASKTCLCVLHTCCCIDTLGRSVYQPSNESSRGQPGVQPTRGNNQTATAQSPWPLQLYRQAG